MTRIVDVGNTILGFAFSNNVFNITTRFVYVCHLSKLIDPIIDQHLFIKYSRCMFEISSNVAIFVEHDTGIATLLEQ